MTKLLMARLTGTQEQMGAATAATTVEMAPMKAMRTDFSRRVFMVVLVTGGKSGRL